MSDKPGNDTEFMNAKSWDLPFLSEEKKVQEDDGKTNALNRRSDWKYEPPEEEEEILPPTMEELESLRQSAYDEGFNEGKAKGIEDGKTQGHEEGTKAGHEEGFKAGHEEGIQAGEQLVNSIAENWQQLADTLSAPLEQVNDETRKQLVKLSVSLARAVIRTEVKTSEDAILQALSEGMKALPIQENKFQLSMHPDDIQTIKDHFGEDNVVDKGWIFIDTPGMQRGGCDIVTAQNAVDVSIERRTRDILDKFLMEQGLNDD